MLEQSVYPLPHSSPNSFMRWEHSRFVDGQVRKRKKQVGIRGSISCGFPRGPLGTQPHLQPSSCELGLRGCLCLGWAHMLSDWAPVLALPPSFG